jgi:hypothetical protein
VRFGAAVLPVVSRQTVEYFEFDATSLADFDTKEIDELDGETAV